MYMKYFSLTKSLCAKYVRKRTIILVAVLVFALAACVSEEPWVRGANIPEVEAGTETNDEAQGSRAGVDWEIPPMPVDETLNWLAPDDLYNPDDLTVLEGPLAYRLQTPTVMLQLQPLIPGEELATIHTNMGDITVRFFPEEAPIAVANFVNHARNGYYDGLLFHRVIPNFMIQGGCPDGTGGGGESVWGGRFDTERSYNLRHFRGALAMAHAGPGTIGSQFYIVQNSQLELSTIQELEEMKNHLDDVIGILPDGTRVYLRDWHPIEGLEYFIENGGTPHLDWFWNPSGPHPVFAHVVSGMDVVDAIANTPQDAGNRPIEDMIIESISFFVYGS